MGSLHNREDTTLVGAFPYSYGHRLCTADGSGFRTVMSYSCTGTSVPRVNFFSNPNITFNGLPTGVPATEPLPCDNAQSLNRDGHAVASFRWGRGDASRGADRSDRGGGYRNAGRPCLAGR